MTSKGGWGRKHFNEFGNAIHKKVGTHFMGAVVGTLPLGTEEISQTLSQPMTNGNEKPHPDNMGPQNTHKMGHSKQASLFQ